MMQADSLLLECGACVLGRRRADSDRRRKLLSFLLSLPAPYSAKNIEQFRNWCCSGDTSHGQNCRAHRALVADASMRGLRSASAAIGTPSRRTNESIWRLQGISRRAFVPVSAVVASAASHGDSAPAADTSDRRRHGERGDGTRIGSVGRTRLSSPRRAQYLLPGLG